MSVKDRISSMNTRITKATVEATDDPDTSLQALKARSSNGSIKSRGSDISLTSRDSQASLRSRGSVGSFKSRGSDISMKTPLKLAGMESEKGAAKFEEEHPQDTDIEEVIQRLKDDDETLTEVNLNNHGGLDAELMAELLDALKDNTCLEVLQLCNVRMDEAQAMELGQVLKINTTIRVLNLESNRITRKGIKAIMKCLSENPDTSLRELRMVNQYFAGGAGAEGEIAKYLVKVNTITKLGYNFTVPSFRTKVDGLIMRNLDYDRKKRAMAS